MPDTPEVAALHATIDFLKLVVYAEAGAIVAVSGFFVAWVRKLYDDRTADGAKQLEERDDLLERVLKACETLADAVAALTAKKVP